MSDALTVAMDLIAHHKHVQIRDPKCATPVRIFPWWKQGSIVRLLSNPTSYVNAEAAPDDWSPDPADQGGAGPVAAGARDNDWPAARVLAKLREFGYDPRGPKSAGQYGEVWRSRCPFHGGKSGTTFRVGEKPDGTAWVKCWAGCSPRDSLAVLQMAPSDLYRKGPRILGEQTAPSATGGETQETTPTGPPLAFRTARQRATEKPPKVDWIIGGLAAAGTVTEVDGPQKTGKTTFIAWAVAAKLAAEPFLGQPTRSGPTVWLTEESWETLQQPLEEAGLLQRDDLHILCREDAFGVSWAEVATQARLFAVKVGANLLIGDTLSSLAGLKGDEENSSGAAMEAMRPVQEIAAKGMAVIVTRHDRRAGGEVGESGRGSTAFAGAVDLIFRFTRLGGDGRASLRKLEYVGRLRGVSADRVIDRTEDGYRFVGTDADVKLQEAKDLLLEFLPDSEEDAVTLPSLWVAADPKKDRKAGPLVGSGIGKSTFRVAADALVGAKRLAKREISDRKHLWWCVSGGTGSAGHTGNESLAEVGSGSMSSGPSPFRDGHTGHRTPTTAAPNGHIAALDDLAPEQLDRIYHDALLEVEL